VTQSTKKDVNAMRLILAVFAILLMSSCATQPRVTKVVMPLGEVDMTGLECRVERPVGTNMPRQICARPEAWAELDERALERKDALLEDARTAGNGRFNTR
jgi:hypothetical protein